MRNIVPFVLIVFVLVRCDSEKTVTPTDVHPQHIIAGDSQTGHDISVSVGNYDPDNPAPPLYTTVLYVSDGVPLDLDGDGEVDDIRCGEFYDIFNHKLIVRGLFITNNYFDNALGKAYEFAISDVADTVKNIDTIKTLLLFNDGDLISDQNLWVRADNPELPDNRYYLSYYYDFDDDKENRLPSDTITGENFNLNLTVQGMYIGVRKKITEDKYIYGWIKFDYDNKKVKFIKSAFTK